MASKANCAKLELILKAETVMTSIVSHAVPLAWHPQSWLEILDTGMPRAVVAKTIVHGLLLRRQRRLLLLLQLLHIPV